MVEEAQTLCESVTFLHYMYIACLLVSGGKQRTLFAPTDVHNISCNIHWLSLERAIANLSYYLPF